MINLSALYHYTSLKEAIRLLCLVFLVASSSAAYAQTPGHSLPSKTVRSSQYLTLLIAQSATYGSPGSSPTVSTTTNIGEISNSLSQVNTTSPANQSATLASSVVLWAPTDYGTQTSAAIVSAAKQYLAISGASIIANVKSALASSAAKSASYQYDQTVKITGIPGSSHLIWTVYIDTMGNVMYGDPEVIPGTPVYISATYTPLAVGQGLPSGWKYPNAGILQYQVIQISNQQVITPLQAVNVNGAYDAPQQVLGAAAVDSDSGLKCLMNKASSNTCAQGFVDMASLAAQYSASHVIVDYLRALNPVYLQNADGTTSPQMSISYNQRIINVASCTNGSYQNIGTYGYLLNQQTDRYFGLPSGRYSLISSASASSQSPTQSFDLSRAITGNQSSGLASQVIDFFTTGNPLVATSQVPQISYLAPITQTGFNGTSLANWTSATRTGTYATTTFRVSCDFSTGTINLWTYWSAYWGQGQHFVDGGVTTAITNVGQNYPIYLVNGVGFAHYWSGGAPYIARLDASNNLWITKNGDPWWDFNGHWETYAAEAAFNTSLYYAYPQLGPDYALEAPWGVPISGTCWNDWGAYSCTTGTEYYTHYLLGFNLTTGQPITTVMDLGDYCAVYGCYDYGGGGGGG